MKKTTLLSFMCLVLSLFLLLTSCGEAGGEAEMGPSPSEGNGSEIVLPEAGKVITEMQVRATTQNFTEHYKALLADITAYGGYVASSSTQFQSEAKSATLTAKIPSERCQAFVDSFSAYLTVNSTSVSTQDVTSEYIDTESRIAALEAERDSLQALMETTGEYAEMMTVSDRLYEVIAELETQKALLASLESRVAYSTVHFTLREEVVEEEENEGFFSALSERFMKSLKGVGHFVTGLALVLLGNLPLWLFLAAIVLLIVLLVRRSKKKAAQRRKEEEEKRKASGTPTPGAPPTGTPPYGPPPYGPNPPDPRYPPNPPYNP